MAASQNGYCVPAKIKKNIIKTPAHVNFYNNFAKLVNVCKKIFLYIHMVSESGFSNIDIRTLEILFSKSYQDVWAT